MKLQKIKLNDLRAVFFPKNFYEEFRYLGSVPYEDSEVLLKHLVIVIDYYARPWYIPRFFLRLLHLLGNDNSIVRIGNYTLHRLHRKLTKGLFIYDYKYKWSSYDLRISAAVPDDIDRLIDAITYHVHYVGYRQELLDRLSKIPDAKYNKYDSLCELINKIREYDKDYD